MADTRLEYVGDGTNDTFSYGFTVIDDKENEFIKVYVNDVLKERTTHYNIENSNSIVFFGTSIPLAGQIVVIERDSLPDTPLVDFNKTTHIKEDELDLSYEHNRNVCAELWWKLKDMLVSIGNVFDLNDKSLKDVGGANFTDNLDMGGNSIVNTSNVNNLTIVSGTDGVNGVDGTDGSDGVDAISIKLVPSSQAIIYDINNSETTTITFTTEVQNAPNISYYDFQVDGVSKQNETTTTFTLPQGDEPSAGTVKKVQVYLRSGTANGTVKAIDTVTVYGVKEGSDAYTAIVSNEAHTLPTTNTNVVNYSGSGTDIRVFKGNTPLTHTTGTPSTGQFKAEAGTQTNITAGARTTVTKTVTNDTARFANASASLQDTGEIEFTVNCEGVSSITKSQTFSRSNQGGDGATGPQGPQGIQGLTGNDGADGKSVLNGTGAPASSLGSNGDFYIDTSNDSIYGPKASGSWGGGTSLIGPQGAQGSPASGPHASARVKANSIGGYTFSMYGMQSITRQNVGRFRIAFNSQHVPSWWSQNPAYGNDPLVVVQNGSMTATQGSSGPQGTPLVTGYQIDWSVTPLAVDLTFALSSLQSANVPNYVDPNSFIVLMW